MPVIRRNNNRIQRIAQGNRVNAGKADDQPVHCHCEERSDAAIPTSGAQQMCIRDRHCIGSESQPMTDEQLEDKFLDLAETSIGVERGRKLIAACRAIETASDVGAIARDAG